MKYAFYANLVCVILIVSFGFIHDKNSFAFGAGETQPSIQAKPAGRTTSAAPSGTITYTYKKVAAPARDCIFADNFQ